MIIILRGKKKKDALAGNRTRIYCLEGNNANHYTTNAAIHDKAMMLATLPHKASPATHIKATIYASHYTATHDLVTLYI